MKKIFSTFLILAFNFSHAQSYTEKYNDLYSRYEYFNNQGKMIGYKYYDNLYKVWKYQELSQSTQDSYISPINSSLINKVLASKQNRLDENIEKVQSSIDEIIKTISQMDVSQATQDAILFKFRKTIKSIEYKNYDYSDNNLTRQLINYLCAEANTIIKIETSKVPPETKNETKNQSFKKNTSVNYTGYKKASYYSPITSEPTMDDTKVIGRVEYGDIYILEKYDDKYYKIKYNNIIGYIFVGWITK